MQKPQNNAYTHPCPNCGIALACELEQGKSTCWCFTLPAAEKAPELSSDSRCLCRHCLEEQRRQQR